MRDLVRRAAVESARRIARAGGAVLLSRRAYAEMLSQRKAAIEELTRLGLRDRRSGLGGVVVSSNRALQLFALLETYFKFVRNPAPLTVIYRSSDERHERAYAEAAAAFAGAPAAVRFLRERSGFRAALGDVLGETRERNVVFLTDDNLFLRPVDFDFAREIDPLRRVLSFRHSPHIRRSYTARMEYAAPEMREVSGHPELLEFDWYEQPAEWSDPWSVDGHVLSTAEVSAMARISDYKAPNSFEAALKSFDDLARGRTGVCHRDSIIVNLPINRVQNEVANRSGGVSPMFLLDKWNEGLAIDASRFEGLVPQATHEEHPISFIPRCSPYPAK